MTRERLMELGVADENLADEILKVLAEEGSVDKEELQKQIDALAGEKNKLTGEYGEKMKTFAVKNAIREAHGKNERAILALIDMEEISVNEDGSLSGLDLQKVKQEAPYLFEQEEKKTKGTGTVGYTKKAEKNETAKKFKDALMRR